METIELMEMAIKQVKQLAKPDDSPMIYIRNEKNELILTLLAGDIMDPDKRYRVCLAIKALKDMTHCKEMVFVNCAWFAEESKDEEIKKLAPSERPDRKECFIINYFSEDKCLLHMLEFNRDKSNKIIWTNETPYNKVSSDGESMRCESRFNPFVYTDAQVKQWLADSERDERDEIIEKGKREKIQLPFDFIMNIYRYQDKAFFQLINAQGKTFLAINPTKDDDKFEEMIKESTQLLNYVGNGEYEKAEELFKKIMEKKRENGEI